MIVFYDSEITPSETIAVSLIGYGLLYHQQYKEFPALREPPTIEVNGFNHQRFEWEVKELTWKNIELYDLGLGKRVSLETRYGSTEFVIKHEERFERLTLKFSGGRFEVTLQNRYYFTIELQSRNEIRIVKVNQPREELTIRIY